MDLVKNNEMSKDDFQKAVKFNGWEVFTQDQIKNYGVYVGALFSKSEKGGLSEEESSALKTGQAELVNLKQVRVVENMNGRIVKSLFFVQEPQVKYEESIEKSINGETIIKGIFLDTPLNQKLERVGSEFVKGCAKPDIRKTEEYTTYKALASRGIEGVEGELKKAYPDMGDDKIEELKKAFQAEVGGEKEQGEQPEEQEEKPEEKEETDEPDIEKAINDTLEVLNDNFNKGLIDEKLAESAANDIDNLIQKARPHKYYKREGGPGNYKYYYTEEQYKKEKGGKPEEKKKEGGEGSEKKESGAISFDLNNDEHIITKDGKKVDFWLGDDGVIVEDNLKNGVMKNPAKVVKKLREVAELREKDGGVERPKDLRDVADFIESFMAKEGSKSDKKEPEKKEPTKEESKSDKEESGGSNFSLSSDDTIKVGSSTLFRVTYKDGTKGGYVESEKNISGNGKVLGNARVYGNATVSGDAVIKGDAEISESAIVSGQAVVSGKSRIHGEAHIYGKSEIFGEAVVSGGVVVSRNAKVYGKAVVADSAYISDNAQVYGRATVYDNAVISDNAQVYGGAEVADDAKVFGDAKVSGDAYIFGEAMIGKGEVLTSGDVGE
jgi:carbonic anhydrase/acetyltransferase-like protein (isoleucine patch superfamily)